MLASSIPTKIVLPFANNAGGSYINVVPVPSQIGITNGAASFYDGFPPNCFVALAAGGAGPFGKDFNGLLNVMSAWERWYCAGGPVAWDSAFSTAIGGYPKGAIVADPTTLGLQWQSTTDNNTSNPDMGGSDWVTWPSIAIYIGFGSVNGLRIANGSTPNTGVTIVLNGATLINAAGQTIGVGAQSITMDLTTGTGGTSVLNGMDGHVRPTGPAGGGSPGYIWLVSDGEGNTGAICSPSPTSPALPTGYSYYKYLGAMMFDSSQNLLRTIQYGKRVQYVVTPTSNTAALPIMAQGSAGPWPGGPSNAIAVGAFVPTPVASVIYITTFGGGASEHIDVAPNANYGPETSTTNPAPIRQVCAGGGAGEGGNLVSLILESTNIYWSNSGSAANMVQCGGWDDNNV